MTRPTLKHHPQLILLWVAKNYLNDSEFMSLLNDIASNKKGDGIFLRKYLKHFDIERIRKKVIVWQDIWIYNYLSYDCKGKKLPKTNLILQYEREIAIPAELHFLELKKYVQV